MLWMYFANCAAYAEIDTKPGRINGTASYKNDGINDVIGLPKGPSVIEPLSKRALFRVGHATFLAAKAGGETEVS